MGLSLFRFKGFSWVFGLRVFWVVGLLGLGLFWARRVDGFWEIRFKGLG